ncbi:MAG: AraC family transcriptional regulator [Burkholderiaceae bacterium]|nr:AraC family transcriptional regulator [Burkholderiaceae bacterium]
MPESEDYARYTTANIPAYLLRCLAATMSDFGIDPARLCLGLGFTVEDLTNPACRVSFRQGSLMIRRALQMAPNKALGLLIGERETIASIGLVGYAMMTSPTLGEATALGMSQQKFAGSMLEFDFVEKGKSAMVTASNRFHEPDIQMFLMEEAFSSFLQIARGLVGNSFAPLRVDLSYPAPDYAAEYDRVFNCPVHFGQKLNAFVSDIEWVARPLLTYDPLSHRQALEFMEIGFSREREKEDLFESVERVVRQNLKNLPSFSEIAKKLCLSERTLRRRLADNGVSYQTLLDMVRKNRALEMLANPKLSIEQVAFEVGFCDAHNFRRAFKRWTGSTPSDMR